MKDKRFLCSRPVSCKTESESNCAHCFRYGIFTCNPLTNNRVSKISKSPERFNPSESEIHHTRSRSLSAAVKALLFEISMRKKIRKGKKSPKSEAKSPMSFADSRIQRIKRNSSESSSSSSNLFGSSHSSPLLENLNGKRKKQSTEKKVNGCWSSLNSELFVILVAFTITILYGKLCAMLFTFMCLYFLTRRRICERRPENLTIPSPGTELQTTDFKKRVVKKRKARRDFYF